MSDDLISRKETEQILRVYADDVGCNRGEYVLANGILKAVSRVIDHEIVPTAYDVGKVIEQLEERKKYLLKDFVLADKAEEVKERTLARINEIDGLIEIVKSGGVTDGN